MLTAAFLCESGPTVGLGHVGRCLVLAKAFRGAGIACRFAVTDRGAFAPVEGAGFPVRLGAAVAAPLAAADIVVADGYAVDRALTRSWGGRFPCRVVIDDLGDRALEAEIVVNHNLYAEEIDYRRWAPAKLCLGPRYALIDPAFHAVAADREAHARSRVLLWFGATDDGTRSEAVVRRLLDLASVEVDVVCSPLRDPAPGLLHLADEAKGRVRVHHGAALAALLRRCRLFVGAAGVAALEAAASATPMVVCAIVANQERNAAALRARGVPAFAAFDPRRLAEAAAAHLADPRPNPIAGLVDPAGPAHVVESVLAHLAEGGCAAGARS